MRVPDGRGDMLVPEGLLNVREADATTDKGGREEVFALVRVTQAARDACTDRDSFEEPIHLAARHRGALTRGE